jgi:hypothetical protein
MSQVLNGFQREVMELFGSIGVLRAITRCGLPYGQLQPDDSVYPALEVVINLRHFVRPISSAPVSTAYFVPR